MENKISVLYRDETKILTWFIWRKIFFQEYLHYTIKNQWSFYPRSYSTLLLSKLFHTITSKASFNKTVE